MGGVYRVCTDENRSLPIRLATAWQQIRAADAATHPRAWMTLGLAAGIVGGFLGTLVVVMLFGIGGWEAVTGSDASRGGGCLGW